MSFVEDVLPLLQCPDCGAPFEFRAVAAPASARAECGLLSCRCGQYPVLDGIPIILSGRIGMFEHTTGATEVAGPAAADLVRLLCEGRTEEALVACLTAPSWPIWLRRLRSRLISPTWAERFARRQGKQAFTALLRKRDTLSARDVLGFYFTGASLSPDMGDYFILRFGQPRYLAALALLSQLDAGDRPLLDVACGCGHLDHYLTCRPHPFRVIGLDLNFYHVWIARHWIAPLGNYICCNVAEGLPFRADSMSAALVSDAYHYFPNRAQFNRELERVAPGRIKILTRVGNRAVRPNEGSELSLREYQAELGSANIRAFSEQRLVRDYLAQRDPFAGEEESVETLEGSKWLAFAVDPPAQPHALPREDKSWPHAVGRISVNPIYTKSIVGDETQLWFKFPRPWYAYENHQMLEYHARHATIGATDMQVLQSGGWNATLQELLDQFALIGLPERF